MRVRARRWVAVLGLAILSLLAVAVLAADRRTAGSSAASRTAAPAGPTAPLASRTNAPATNAPATTAPASPTTGPRIEAAASPPPPSTTASGAAIPTTTSRVTWVERKVSLTYQGLNREYLMFRPAAVQATRIPVVVELAGCCIDVAQEAGRANFRAVAGPAIIVYPSYYEENWNAGACCGPPASSGVDDVGFVTTVVDQVRTNQPDASPGPAYLAGYSNGGKLAMELACRQPGQFAAVAVYGATRTSGCSGPPPESVLVMAGTADPEVAVGPGPPVVQNGFTEPTVNQLVASYLAADGCTATRQTFTAGTVLAGRWVSCGGGRQVGEVLYRGLDHNWPERSGSTPSGQQVMWDFFVALGA